MTGTSATRDALVRRCFAAYAQHDRSLLDGMIAEDFHFTSPYDDAIDRDEYFRRCWPNHERMRDIAIERIVPDGDAASVVTYTLHTKDGRRIHNTERLTFRGEQLVAVEVFFGAVRDARGAFQAMSHA